MTKQLSEHFAARFKSCTAEQQLPLRNNLVKTFLRTMLFLAVMAIGTGSAWGQDVTFEMGGMWADKTIGETKLTFKGGGPSDVHESEGVTDLSTKEEDGVKTSAQILLDCPGVKFIKITFADNENTYKLLWGGSWESAASANANNAVSGKGTLILTSNSGVTHVKIINNVAESTETTPIKKIEVYYNHNFGTTAGQTEANATKTISELSSNLIPLDKINVVGEYCLFNSTTGQGVMLSAGANHYFSIKFDGEHGMDLSDVTNFTIHGTNVQKQGNSEYVFDEVLFICEDGNVSKSWEPSNNVFEIGGDQSSKLAKTKEIRILNGSREGVFTIEDIKLYFNSRKEVSFSSNEDPKGTVAATVDGNAINSGDIIDKTKSVTFTATPADGKLFWYWKKNGTASYDATNPITVPVSSDLDYQAVFTDGVKHNVYTNDSKIGTVKITRDGNGSNTTLHVNPGTPNISFVATEVEANSFVGWYTTAERTTPAPDGDGCTYTDKTYKLNGSQLNNGLTLFAKFETKTYVPSCDWGGTGYTQVLSPTSANAGIAPFSVKMGGVTVDKADYTLSYSVKSGPISVTADGKITVDSEDASVKALKDGYSTPVDAYITVTANPNNASYTAGSVDLHVQIKAVTNGTVKLNPSEVRIGDYFDVTIERGTGFPNIKYYWTFPANTTNVYGYNGDAIVQTETTRDGVAIPYQFLATGATSGKMDIYVRIESPKTATEYKGLYGSGITIKPITIPTIDQEGSDIIINYEEDFVNRKDEEVDAFLEYWIGEKIDANKHQTGFGNNASTLKLKDQPVGTVITAKSVVRFKKPDNPEEFIYASSDEVTYTVKKPFQTITVNGTERQYDLYKPEGITGTVGVVLSLHRGGEDVSEGTSGRVYFNDIADDNKDDNDKKFIVVSPRALIRNGVRNWQLDETSADDTEFFKAIVKDIDGKNGLTVDYSRIYLAGYSDGGAMAFKVAHKDADFYAAIASVSGVPYDNNHLWHAGKKPVPFLFIQGGEDGIFRDQIGIQNVTNIAHNMMYRNGAAFSKNNGTLSIAGTNESIIYDCHEAETGGAAFYHYTIPGMYHSSENNWDGTTGDDVAPTMWAFFNKADKVKSVDETLKFRVNDPTNFWAAAGSYGFENVNTGTSVLTYGGATKNDTNKNIYHSLQFNGGNNGVNHYLKIGVSTEQLTEEQLKTSQDYFMVKLVQVNPSNGAETKVFSKRYQTGKGSKPLYINFAALPGLNEYKLYVTKSNTTSDFVKINTIEFHSGLAPEAENPQFYAQPKLATNLGTIYQPVYGASYNGQAKEYLAIANIPLSDLAKDKDEQIKVNGTAIDGPIPAATNTPWENNGQKGIMISTHESGSTDANNSSVYKSHKANNLVWLNADDSHIHTVNTTDGLCISEYGKAEMQEYLDGTKATFPDHGVVAFEVSGTVDFILIAQNKLVDNGSGYGNDRRYLKAWYKNNQSEELHPLIVGNEGKNEWFFNRSRNELTGGGAALSGSIRLQHLGSDGKCYVFLSYESPESDENVWIKGMVVKRPDLRVTIGRTDSKYAGESRGGETENTELTRYGENRPYIWDFQNVGFNNTAFADQGNKKYNKYDWRTYVCGTGNKEMDHLLVYSELGTEDDYLEKVAQFDGRVHGQEHIEFLNASQYTMKEPGVGRTEFNPIHSNGIKVNVTGSGWFKIKCSAPNGPVKMKVYSSTNYGITYTNLLREFIVDNTKHPASATGEEEHRWGEYTVYLKGHVELKKSTGQSTQQGFWDGEEILYNEDKVKNAEEKVRMSLYIVYDEIEGQSYIDNDEGTHKGHKHAQLNIHQLSWLNEEPADYVFQREEDPKLLTTWQKIKRDINKDGTVDENEVVLWWKAANDDDDEYPILKGHANGSYNVINQINTDNAAKGVKSPGGYASTSVPSDAGAYDAYWDIAAPARVNALVEKSYGNNQKASDTQYDYGSGNNTEFDTPVSGSFIRISAMQNTYVVAHVIPGNTSVDANATLHSGATVYVLDETGNPIPSSSSEPSANRLGYIAAMVNGGSAQNGGVASQDKTIRIDFVANAGKEYFICANDASISLARLEVHDWRYNPTKVSTPLALVDDTGTDNSTTITTAYDAGKYYMNATLNRTFAAGKWASLVLPFSLNEQKFKEVFGENAKCIHFTDVDTENNIVKLTHHYYNMIVAGRPVFVYTPDEVVDPQFEDITLQTKEVNNTTTTSGFTFHASYNGTQMNWNDLYMNNANAIKYVSNDKSKHLTYPGMRSFIQSPNDYDPSNGRAGAVGAKAIFLNFFDGGMDDVTGIEALVSAELGENVVVVTKNTKIYDLLGNPVADGSRIDSLPAGIYIVNGKKYIVK